MGPRSLAFLLALGVAAASAAAQPDAAPAPSPERAEADAAWKRGRIHYHLGEYAKAIDEFKAAYRVTGSPQLLYDIAQAHRMRGPSSCGEALRAYRAYLRDEHHAERRELAERHVRAMEECVARRAAASKPAPGGPGRGATERSIVPTLLLGAGAVTAVAGGGLILWAHRDYANLEDDCAPTCPTSRWKSVRFKERAGYAAVAVGLAVAITGGSLRLFGHPAEVVVVPPTGATGAVAGLSGRF